MTKKGKSDDSSAQPGAAAGTATRPVRAAVPAEATVRKPTHEEISRRAYEIWMARGKGLGGEVEDWLQAEKQLADDQPLNPPNNPDTGCTTSFFLEERDEIGKVCAIEPDPKTEYVQPDDDKEDGGEA